jgi:hypothetical protein
MSLVLGSSVFANSDQTLEEIFFMQRHQFGRLNAIDMTYMEEFKSRSDRKDASASSDLVSKHKIKMRFQAEGDRFRVETGLDGTWVNPEIANNVSFSISAFDLNKYQQLEKESLNLAVQNEKFTPTDKTNLPLTWPYEFLSIGQLGVVPIEKVRDKAEWDRILSRAKISGNEVLDCHECILVEIQSPKNKLWRVYFAKDLEYYPIKNQTYDKGRKMQEIVVRQVKKNVTTSGDVFIPMDIVCTQFGAITNKKLFEWKYLIEEETLSVNNDIPDEIFTIPLYMANSFEDIDNKENTLTPQEVIDESIKERYAAESSNDSTSKLTENVFEKQFSNYKVLIFVAVFLCVFMLLLYRYFLRKQPKH